MNKEYTRPPEKRIAEVNPDAMFDGGLEYNPPARGPWNIVHTGMLIPEARQIFVCARGCLRGVILTAAEMYEIDRMSWVSVDESDLFDGSIEQKVIDGVVDIINRLKNKPPAVLLFLSCIHLFAGCDFERMLDDLRETFPKIKFTDCYMTPTMRKTITPDARMREQLYSLIDPTEIIVDRANIIGNDLPTGNSELLQILSKKGYRVRDINDCETFEEYQELGAASVNISYLPNAMGAAEKFSERMGSKHLHFRTTYDLNLIGEEMRRMISEIPDLPKSEKKKSGSKIDIDEMIATSLLAAKDALDKTAAALKGRTVGIDYTAVPYPFELAKLLAEHGFDVGYVIADTVAPEEREAFDWLKENRPDLRIMSALNVNMINMPEMINETGLDKNELKKSDNIVAIGQKAAHYLSTDNFVNIISGGGFRDYAGIVTLMELIRGAAFRKKDRLRVLKHKGFGCSSCLFG